jgi:hypothetical protein
VPEAFQAVGPDGTGQVESGDDLELTAQPIDLFGPGVVGPQQLDDDRQGVGGPPRPEEHRPVTGGDRVEHVVALELGLHGPSLSRAGAGRNTP